MTSPQRTVAVRHKTPPALNGVVSAQMRQMRRAGTGPETALRRELHRRGLRFRVNLATLPGRPDLAFTRARLAVFIDGCFWHRCPQHGVLPKNNREWWLAKLNRNVERDGEKDTALTRLGWLPVHVWEHENVGAVADLVEREWRRLIDTRAKPGRMSWPAERV